MTTERAAGSRVPQDTAGSQFKVGWVGLGFGLVCKLGWIGFWLGVVGFYFGLVGLEWVWVRFWIRSGWVGLRWVGLRRVGYGLDCIGLGRGGLDGVGSRDGGFASCVMLYVAYAVLPLLLMLCSTKA